MIKISIISDIKYIKFEKNTLLYTPLETELMVNIKIDKSIILSIDTDHADV